MAKLAVLGAGSWGTALANLLSNNGHAVTLWGHEVEHVNEILRSGYNAKYLKGLKLSSSLKVSSNLHESVKNVDGILVATPSYALREVLKKISNIIASNAVFILACKGFEEETGLMFHEVFNQEIKQNSLTILSGPTFAKEVMSGLPTAVTIASKQESAGSQVVSWFHNGAFRPYYSADVIGVELGGAVKNIFAIASGISDGLSLGANSRAALITRGLSELINLGVSMGAKKETLMGLSGVGDLVLTCTDNLSRNRQLGLLLASGKSLNEAKDIIGQEVEGIRAAKITKKLLTKNKIEAPIIENVYNVLFKSMTPKEAVFSLMSREIKAE